MRVLDSNLDVAFGVPSRKEAPALVTRTRFTSATRTSPKTPSKLQRRKHRDVRRYWRKPDRASETQGRDMLGDRGKMGEQVSRHQKTKTFKKKKA